MNVTVTAEDVGSEQLRQEIEDKYHEKYKKILQNLRVNMDLTQLGLKKSQHIFDAEKGDFEASNSKLYTEITIKWNSLELGLIVDDMAMECSDFESCRSMKRINFVMNLFDTYFLKHFCRGTDTKDDGKTNNNFVEIFAHCLSDYNGIALLNDLEHIRDHKVAVPLMDCPHSTDDGECIGESMRLYRGSDNDIIKGEFEEYMDGLSLRERNLVKTASRIHSFICHEDHSEKKADDKTIDDDSLEQIVTAGRKEQMSSKFVNEIESDQSTEKKEVKRMDDLAAILNESGLSNLHSTRFINELFEQQYDSDAIVDDLVDVDNDPFNVYEDTNLFPFLQSNPFLAKITKKHFGVSGNDDDQLPLFSFGKHRLYQWEHFKDYDGYVGSARYGSLKEECLSNRIYNTSMRQFSEMLCSAYMFRESAKGRAFKARNGGNRNNEFEVAVDFPLSVCYIFVLLMYCNLTDLQYKYKKIGCREGDNGQTLEELIDWNKEIWHWHRYIYEVVEFFGGLARPSQVFYTGLNTKLSFPSFAPIFNAPISTTTSVDIANGFCGGDGMILKMKSTTASGDGARYFNVEWLSAFAHEKERVFVRADDLRIADIKYYAEGKWQNNQRYLRAFSLFSALFTGQLISPILRVKSKNNQSPCKVLLNLIHVYKFYNNFEMKEKNVIDIPLYIQQLFYQLLHRFQQKKGSKYLVKSEYDLLDQSLRDELPVEQIGIQLPPFMKWLCPLGDIVMMSEYHWVIDREQVTVMRDAKHNKWIYSKTHYFKLSSEQRVSIQFFAYVHSMSTDWGGFGCKILETPTPLNVRMSFIVDELDVFYNNMIEENLQKGNSDNRWIFKHHMLKKVDTLTIKFVVHFAPSELMMF